MCASAMEDAVRKSEEYARKQTQHIHIVNATIVVRSNFGLII